MCDTCPTPININFKVPRGKMASRRSSNASIGRRASASGSKASVASSLPVPQCMRPPPSMSQCCNHPRPDCCRVPCCKPPLPRCPLGVFVERTKPIRPLQSYEPPVIPFEGLSSYREQFHLKCGERVKSLKPLSTFDPSTAKMDGLSSYREAFVPKPLCPYKKPPWSVKARFEPSDAKLDGISTYRSDFKGCSSERVLSLKPLSTFDPSTAKMEGCTTYRCTYVPYCPREYQYAKPPSVKNKATPGFSCAPMEGCTTYRSDFFPKCYAKRQSMKPSTKARFSDSKFADRTTYRNDYFPFHFDKCVGQNCIPAEIYDEKYPTCGIFACGAEQDVKSEAGDEENCPTGRGCCPGGPVYYPGSCGNEMGIFPDRPLPECCRLDDPPLDTSEDC